MGVVREAFRQTAGEIGDWAAFALMWAGVFQAAFHQDGVVAGLTLLGLVGWTALNFRNYRRRQGLIPA